MKIIKHITYIALTTFCLTGCDNISENERFIEVETTEATKCVLIEDFTGQKCVNCPNAAEEAHKIQEMYGTNKVVVVSIHAGFMGVPVAKGGLMTDTGNEYADYWKVEAYPSGLIDRKEGLFDYPAWAAQTYKYIKADTPVDMEISSDYNESNKTVEIKIEATGLESIAGKLQIWLTESNIISPQSMPEGGTNTNYVHNHVFRTTVNGTWGEDIQINEGESKEVTHSYQLDDKWKPENMSIIAFIYDNNGVMQTTTCEIINNNY